jgi:hypothetical protein
MFLHLFCSGKALPSWPNGARQTVIDDGVSKRLTLKKGPNVVRCAVVNGGGATDFCARFLDRKDAPMKNFTVNLGEAVK